MIDWRHEDYDGVGPEHQPLCAIPMCQRPTMQRGLCDTCYHAWWRGGMEGLERRARRCAGTLPAVRVPLKLADAVDLLVEVYERWREEEDDEKWQATRKKLIRICAAIGDHERRKKQRDFRDLYRDRFIAKHGLLAWRAKEAASQRAYRRRKQARLEGQKITC